MTNSLHLRVVSQENEVFNGKVEAVFCRSFAGELGIYPGHAQLLSLLRPGVVRLKIDGREERALYISGGILEIQPESVVILGDVVERAEEIDRASVEEAMEQARQILAKGLGHIEDPQDFYEAQQGLAEASARLRVLGL